MQIISMDMAKRHLRIDASDGDIDLDWKMQAAEEIVLDYLKSNNSGWSDIESVPKHIQHATLLVLGTLWESREADADPLSETVRALLHRSRDPALA